METKDEIQKRQALSEEELKKVNGGEYKNPFDPNFKCDGLDESECNEYNKYQICKWEKFEGLMYIISSIFSFLNDGRCNRIH